MKRIASVEITLTFLLLALPVWQFSYGSHDSVVRGSIKSEKKGSRPQTYASNELTPEEEKLIVRLGRIHDVPQIEQEGDTCGIAALAMVMAYYHKKDPRNNGPRPYKNGPGDPNLKPILDWAKDSNKLWSKEGGTTVDNLRDIARDYRYNAGGWISCLNPVDCPDLTELRKMVNFSPVIVAISDVDEKGNVITGKNMFGGHWVVVEGFYRYKGQEYVIVKHGNNLGGKHIGGSHLWRVQDFAQSWKKTYYSTVQVHPMVEQKSK